MSAVEQLKSVEEFFFGAPLYRTYTLGSDDDSEILKLIYGRYSGRPSIDGHCPYCGRASTFFFGRSNSLNDKDWFNVETRIAFDVVWITCVRSADHRIHYYFKISNLEVQKIGQFPSLADISNDEVARYRKNMEEQDAREFHKAIGLAAHGIGVGSFVYMRRVFERLINKRFEEFKKIEGWKDNDFFGLRMTEKVEMLADHLPDFLVKNAKIYAVLSKGIHELDEAECLGYFDVMKHSIVIILDEDKRKQEERELKDKLTKAISAALPRPGS